MKKEIFNKGIEELLIAFPKMEMKPTTAEVWYKYSKQLSDFDWEKKIKNCILRCEKYAPLLADIMDAKNRYSEFQGNYRT